MIDMPSKEDVANNTIVLQVTGDKDSMGRRQFYAWWFDPCTPAEGGPPDHVRGQVFHTYVEDFVKRSRQNGRRVVGKDERSREAIPPMKGRVHPSILEPGDIITAPWSRTKMLEVESVKLTTLGEATGGKFNRTEFSADDPVWQVDGWKWFGDDIEPDESDRDGFAFMGTGAYGLPTVIRRLEQTPEIEPPTPGVEL